MAQPNRPSPNAPRTPLGNQQTSDRSAPAGAGRGSDIPSGTPASGARVPVTEDRRPQQRGETLQSGADGRGDVAAPTSQASQSPTDRSRPGSNVPGTQSASDGKVRP